MALSYSIKYAINVLYYLNFFTEQWKKAFKSYDCLDSLRADVGTRGIGLNYLFDRTAYNYSRNNFGTILIGIHRASA